MTQPRKRNKLDELELEITEEQLELLRYFDFPCTEDILANPVRDGGRVVLRMSRLDLDKLVEWVAGEANHSKKRRQALLLNELADEMESLLDSSS